MLNLVEKFTPAVEANTDDAGLTTVEYAIAAAVVAGGVIGAFTLLGGNVLTRINNLVTGTNPPAAPAAP